MNTIIEKVNQFKYSSLEYVDSEDIRNPVISTNNDESIFFYCKEEGEIKILKILRINLEDIKCGRI